MTATPHIIDRPLSHFPPGKARIELEADRATLAKRRWRGAARDGAEFGFDLAHPLEDGAVFFENEAAAYVIAQKPEPVLEILLGDPVHAARLGWSLGNLHFPVEIDGLLLRVVDDIAVRIYLERDHVPFTPRLHLFHPLKTSAHGHDHGHGHGHGH